MLVHRLDRRDREGVAAQLFDGGPNRARSRLRLLEPYQGTESERVALEGSDAVVRPNAANFLALILHEFATNAVKHGALSAENITASHIAISIT